MFGAKARRRIAELERRLERLERVAEISAPVALRKARDEEDAVRYAQLVKDCH
jgi:hypothetical protein